jgi:hypothetical protein
MLFSALIHSIHNHRKNGHGDKKRDKESPGTRNYCAGATRAGSYNTQAQVVSSILWVCGGKLTLRSLYSWVKGSFARWMGGRPLRTASQDERRIFVPAGNWKSSPPTRNHSLHWVMQVHRKDRGKVWSVCVPAEIWNSQIQNINLKSFRVCTHALQ